MAFCSKCGTQIGDNENFCPNCGTQVGATEASQTSKQETATEKVNAAWTKFNDTADSSAKYDKTDIENNKVMGILAYIGILVLIPLFGAKGSKFARFHTNQGLILFVIEIICSLLSWIPIVKIFTSIISVVTFLFSILGIVNVCNGKAKELPIIGGIRFLS